MRECEEKQHAEINVLAIEFAKATGTGTYKIQKGESECEVLNRNIKCSRLIEFAKATTGTGTYKIHSQLIIHATLSVSSATLIFSELFEELLEVFHADEPDDVQRHLSSSGRDQAFIERADAFASDGFNQTIERPGVRHLAGFLVRFHAHQSRFG